jgi:hypothetical protein
VHYNGFLQVPLDTTIRIGILAGNNFTENLISSSYSQGNLRESYFSELVAGKEGF